VLRCPATVFLIVAHRASVNSCGCNTGSQRGAVTRMLRSLSYCIRLLQLQLSALRWIRRIASGTEFGATLATKRVATV
jgi:hypothetical protein